MMIPIFQLLQTLVEVPDYLRPMSGTLFPVEQELLGNEKTALQAVEELQLKTYFQKEQVQQAYAHREIRPQSPLSAFRLFIDEPMLRSILKFTVNHGKADNPNFSVEIRELEKFIGLQIARGVLVEKNTPIYQLWSKEWAHPIFGKTMSRDRYKELMRHLRFDNFSTRRERREKTSFASSLKLGRIS